jgi:hypothetical protein
MWKKCQSRKKANQTKPNQIKTKRKNNTKSWQTNGRNLTASFIVVAAVLSLATAIAIASEKSNLIQTQN